MTIVDKVCLECNDSLWSGDFMMCRWCNQEITASRRRTWCSDKCRREFERNHVWRRARAYAKRKAKYVCVVDECKVGGRGTLDVHHVVPRNGAGYGVGCHHHQSGLQVLCKAHHLVETKRERREKRNLN